VQWKCSVPIFFLKNAIHVKQTWWTMSSCADHTKLFQITFLLKWNLASTKATLSWLLHFQPKDPESATSETWNLYSHVWIWQNYTSDETECSVSKPYYVRFRGENEDRLTALEYMNFLKGCPLIRSLSNFLLRLFNNTWKRILSLA